MSDEWRPRKRKTELLWEGVLKVNIAEGYLLSLLKAMLLGPRAATWGRDLIKRRPTLGGIRLGWDGHEGERRPYAFSK